MVDLELKIGRLEDKLELYEPIFTSLAGLASLPAELGQINIDLRILKDSRIEVRERLTTLFKTQTRGYNEIIKKLEEEAKAWEKERRECPIKDVAGRLITVERYGDTIKGLSGRMKAAEDTIDSFKEKGWDILFKLAPWIIAVVALGWAALH